MPARRRAAVDDQLHLAAIVESARDAIIGCSLDGTILSWNRAAADGTSFKILFPAASTEAKTTVPEVVDVHDWRGSGTVVVADDGSARTASSGRAAGLRLMATAMLEELGFAVIPAKDGPEALEIVYERDGDLAFVLLDLMMPGMDGEEVLRELEQLETTTPIVISSGYNTQHLSQALTGRGVAAFLQKPYEFSQMQEIARRVIVSRARP